MYRNRTRGFTLVEIMVVVALIGILAAMAMISYTSNRALNLVDNWTRQNRDAILTASRHAVAARNHPYMVEFTPSTVQWCEMVNPGTPPTYTDAQTTCVGQGTGEVGLIISAGNTQVAAQSSFWAASTDIVDASGAYLPATKNSLIGGKTLLYLGRNGTASTILKNVQGSALTQFTGIGFTLYTRRADVDIVDARRRLLVYGLTTKTRIIEDR